ncbi:MULTISPECIES: uracil-DNA glycosylase family protein [unclassified Brevundimonas]|uniref:uracil-DNA glycosylase n=1 Tax=unclassified Brevundimonas TaxID=2622653 RepID=UPI000CFB734D|nr:MULTISPECIES: uracil-DNA glycosylase [unclassified Brevundimonas]PRA35776.1 uracil-DNA glycosylase [Brevundimonas sp. MYb27]PQZ83127.1 uracil-DNA glycosylase [Brevundimonas sp. MYb31]PRB16313.1 uracil-DNA glycosylase [Brevundimonas sp. MYb52]PRB34912.1 uracil-DNA glycosylase [Brevundimonas sp. MYb46]PRB55580.1 uracil-DNA glycosylase [Brevundimonas sp. MYb33]
MTPQPLETAATEALLAFWRDAGVDACYLNEPVDRTVFVAPPAPQMLQKAAATVTTLHGGMSGADAVAEARRVAAAATTMDDLAQAIAAFEGCPLRAMGAKQAVFARGNPKGSILLIGEAPGETEDLRGEPFVGQAGQLLDRMLAAAGLADQAFMTNTVFWKPPGSRSPSPQEQAACAPFVERAFALMQPKAVLLVGAAAAKSVLDTEEGLMKIRGQWREWRLDDGSARAPAMATLHPAFLLRQPQAKRVVWADMLSLTARLDTAQVEPNA